MHPNFHHGATNISDLTSSSVVGPSPESMSAHQPLGTRTVADLPSPIMLRIRRDLQMRAADSFLPYEVEFTFGAALNLTMANALFPDVVDFDSCHDMAHQILNDLVYRGNRVAKARLLELCYLEDLCSELISRGQQKGLQPLDLSVPELYAVHPGRKPSQDHERLLSTGIDSHPLANPTMNSISNLQPPNETEFLDNIGISSEEFLSIVQQMGDSETFPDSMLTLV